MTRIIMKELHKGDTTHTLLTSLEKMTEEADSKAPPNSKRQKRDGGHSLTVQDRAVLCSAVKMVLEEKPPCPLLWRVLMRGNENHLTFLLKVGVCSIVS